MKNNNQPEQALDELDHLIADIWDNQATIADLRTHINRTVVKELKGLLEAMPEKQFYYRKGEYVAPIGSQYFGHNEAIDQATSVIESAIKKIERGNHEKRHMDS